MLENFFAWQHQSFGGTEVVDRVSCQIPADLTVSGARAGSATELNGSRINHGVSYANGTFTADGLKDLGTPRATN